MQMIDKKRQEECQSVYTIITVAMQDSAGMECGGDIKL